MTKEEIEGYRANDPIDKFKGRVLRDNLATAAELEKIDAQVKATLDEAVAYAESSPWPTPDELLKDVYSVYSRQRR
jgi:pyruvate dehydrogenase E1 component alpha subunit